MRRRQGHLQLNDLLQESVPGAARLFVGAGVALVGGRCHRLHVGDKERHHARVREQLTCDLADLERALGGQRSRSST